MVQVCKLMFFFVRRRTNGANHPNPNPNKKHFYQGIVALTRKNEEVSAQAETTCQAT